mgnify:FL=1
MVVFNKWTGRNVSSEYLALMEGIITKDEFEVIACIVPTEGIINVVKDEE